MRISDGSSDVCSSDLAGLMVGRKVLLSVAKQAPRAGETVLVVEDITFVDRAGVARVDHVSFGVRGGEIVGIAGVSGNGQSELLELLSGIRPITSGSFDLLGERFSAERPRSEERRGGKAGGSTCRCRWSPYH